MGPRVVTVVTTTTRVRRRDDDGEDKSKKPDDKGIDTDSAPMPTGHSPFLWAETPESDDATYGGFSSNPWYRTSPSSYSQTTAVYHGPASSSTGTSPSGTANLPAGTGTQDEHGDGEAAKLKSQSYMEYRTRHVVLPTIGAVLAVAALLGFSIFFCCRKRRKARKYNGNCGVSEEEKGPAMLLEPVHVDQAPRLPPPPPPSRVSPNQSPSPPYGRRRAPSPPTIRLLDRFFSGLGDNVSIGTASNSSQTSVSRTPTGLRAVSPPIIRPFNRFFNGLGDNLSISTASRTPARSGSTASRTTVGLGDPYVDNRSLVESPPPAYRSLNGSYPPSYRNSGRWSRHSSVRTTQSCSEEPENPFDDAYQVEDNGQRRGAA